MNALLTVSPFWGIFWLILLFILCFFGVHIARLARLGQRYRKSLTKQEKHEKKESGETPPQPKTLPNEREPIYYIVERKKRAKTNYSEPKEIRFK